MSNEPLIAIEPHQEWCCYNGCGPCTPVQIDREYSRTTAPDGTVLESKTEKVWASNCCHANLSLWDNLKNDDIDHPHAFPDC